MARCVHECGRSRYGRRRRNEPCLRRRLPRGVRRISRWTLCGVSLLLPAMKLQDTQRLRGLVAATHTPFHSDGSLNLGGVEKQAAHLLANQVTTVFIGGTTGESSSLSLDERHALARRWTEVARGTPMLAVLH